MEPSPITVSSFADECLTLGVARADLVGNEAGHGPTSETTHWADEGYFTWKCRTGYYRMVWRWMV